MSAGILLCSEDTVSPFLPQALLLPSLHYFFLDALSLIFIGSVYYWSLPTTLQTIIVELILKYCIAQLTQVRVLNISNGLLLNVFWRSDVMPQLWTPSCIWFPFITLQLDPVFFRRIPSFNQGVFYNNLLNAMFPNQWTQLMQCFWTLVIECPHPAISYYLLL